MKKLITLILIFTAFVSVNAFSQGPSPAPFKTGDIPKTHTDGKNNASKDHQQSTNSTISISARDADQQTNNKGNNGNSETTTNRWIALFTLVLALAAVAQFFTTLIQLRRLRQTVDATKEAAKAAKKAAEALPNIERAYIFVDSCMVDGMIPFNTEISDFNILVELSNIGRTPAVLTKLNCDVVWGIGYPIKYSEHGGKVPHGWASLAAGEKMKYKIPIHIPRDILSKIILHELKLVCYGLIEYQDVWRDRHETGFCWEIIPYRDATLGYIVVSKGTLVNDNPLNKYT